MIYENGCVVSLVFARAIYNRAGTTTKQEGKEMMHRPVRTHLFKMSTTRESIPRRSRTEKKEKNAFTIFFSLSPSPLRSLSLPLARAHAHSLALFPPENLQNHTICGKRDTAGWPSKRTRQKCKQHASSSLCIPLEAKNASVHSFVPPLSLPSHSNVRRDKIGDRMFRGYRGGRHEI